MERTFFWIWEVLPVVLKIFWFKRNPEIFFNNERIVRHISSDHCNKSKKALRANFVAFSLNPKTGKYELSCNRLEMEVLSHVNELGELIIPKDKKCEGFACISVSIVKSFKTFSMFYSPLHLGEHFNFSHSDIYNNALPGKPKHELGEALIAEMNFEREQFVKKWKPYFKGDEIIQKSFVTHF